MNERILPTKYNPACDWIHLFRLQGWKWLLLPGLALWPVWQWSAARLTDGSDDPFGIIALLALLAFSWRDRVLLRATPRPGLVIVSVTACLLATPLLHDIPPLIRAIAGIASVMAMLFALREPGQPAIPVFGLGVLSLPILSSLQFFAGYPLRMVTAGVSAWLLQGFGIDCAREGTALEVAGHLVMVDAPCSGIHMAWAAYFTACVAGTWLRLPDRTFLRRLPWLSLLIIAGNVIRNTLLVIKESGILPLPQWTHEGIGLLIFAGVCVLILRLMARPFAPQPLRATIADSTQRAGSMPYWSIGGFVMMAVLPLLLAPATRHQPETGQATILWPETMNGHPLRPLPLSAVEKRFAMDFPGAIARFAEGNAVITLRHVTRATRKLHPASDCYKGLGYTVSHEYLRQRRDAMARHALQHCFTARRSGVSLLVCEFIQDKAGKSFTDTSAWYWAALTGQSQGPWQAVTTARVQ